MLRHALLFALALSWLLAGGVGGAAALAEEPRDAEAREAPRIGPSGLPLPRFVALRASEVNLRTGPGLRYPIDWVYALPGLPVEIIDEFETWRRIRDWQGSVGWVHQSMLKGSRGALVVGGERKLRRSPEADAPGVARLGPGVIGELRGCAKGWCEISAGGYEGWLRASDLYGVYPGETFE